METIYLLFIVLLAAMLGFELIRKVPSTLHTPLMSGSNAISGVTLVGALVAHEWGAHALLGAMVVTSIIGLWAARMIGRLEAARGLG